MNFQLRNYNEFKGNVRWRDIINLTFDDFAVILVRRYDWLDNEETTFIIQLFGFVVFNKLYPWENN